VEKLAQSFSPYENFSWIIRCNVVLFLNKVFVSKTDVDIKHILKFDSHQNFRDYVMPQIVNIKIK